MPDELGACVELDWLDLSQNKLSGAISPSVGKLVKLKTLILDENALEGRVPDELGACVELQELNVGQNKLSGAIPPSMGKLIKLKKLELYQNALEGRVPDELGACVELEELYLFRGSGNNKLSRNVPASFRNALKG